MFPSVQVAGSSAVCGIVGYYGIPLKAAPLAAMLNVIEHRGPDAKGEYRDPGAPHSSAGSVALGHQRLSIIDLGHRSDQPLCKDGLVITYNGEIYNYREVKAELGAAGVRFLTTSDTEVILEAWRRWGPRCLARLRGMFAFALYDERTRVLYLARDPFGIKPLFVYDGCSCLVFGSEPKAILQATGALETNPTGIIACLVYGWLPEGHSIYHGIRQLPPGHWAEYRLAGEYHEHRYFDPVEEARAASAQPIEISELRTIIEDAVRVHTVADVPVGTLLSGGLDSSIVTVLAARHIPKLDCYTISFRGQDQAFEAMPDDVRYARTVAHSRGLRLNEIELAPELTSYLPEMVRLLDEPLGDAATINTFLICHAARQCGIKVLLSGMGADEMFGGYRRHYANILARRYRRLPQTLRQRFIEPIVKILPVASARRGHRYVRWAKRFLEFASLNEEAAYRRSYTYYDESELTDLLEPDLLPIVDELVEEHAEIYEAGPSDDSVNRMCLTDVRMFLPGLNLKYSDRASMAASTELRVPLVDVSVMNAAFRASGSRKIYGGQAKAVLKKAAEAWLPREIIYRPKAAFGAPLRAWIRRDLVEMIDDLVLGGGLASRGMFRREVIERIIREDRCGIHDHAQRIWNLLTIELWFRSQQTNSRTVGVCDGYGKQLVRKAL